MPLSEWRKGKGWRGKAGALFRFFSTPQWSKTHQTLEKLHWTETPDNLELPIMKSEFDMNGTPNVTNQLHEISQKACIEAVSTQGVGAANPNYFSAVFCLVNAYFQSRVDDSKKTVGQELVPCLQPRRSPQLIEIAQSICLDFWNTLPWSTEGTHTTVITWLSMPHHGQHRIPMPPWSCDYLCFPLLPTSCWFHFKL